MPNEAKNMSELAGMELAGMCVLHSKMPTLNRRHPNFSKLGPSQEHGIMSEAEKCQGTDCLVPGRMTKQQDRYCFIR